MQDALKNDESLNMSLVYDAMDMFKRAVVATRDVEVMLIVLPQLQCKTIAKTAVLKVSMLLQISSKGVLIISRRQLLQ